MPTIDPENLEMVAADSARFRYRASDCSKLSPRSRAGAAAPSPRARAGGSPRRPAPRGRGGPRRRLRGPERKPRQSPPEAKAERPSRAAAAAFSAVGAIDSSWARRAARPPAEASRKAPREQHRRRALQGPSISPRRSGRAKQLLDIAEGRPGTPRPPGLRERVGGEGASRSGSRTTMRTGSSVGPCARAAAYGGSFEALVPRPERPPGRPPPARGGSPRPGRAVRKGSPWHGSALRGRPGRGLPSIGASIP